MSAMWEKFNIDSFSGMENVMWVEMDASMLCFRIAKSQPLLIQLVHFQGVSRWSSWMPTMSDCQSGGKYFETECGNYAQDYPWVQLGQGTRHLHYKYILCPTTRTLQVSWSESHSLLFGKHFSAGKLYNNITEGHTTWKAVIEKYNSALTRHHKINYTSSKVIMENAMHKLYPNHTICIVRPSRDRTQ